MTDAWRSSGCADITAPGAEPPPGFVERVLALIRALDARGTGLADEFPGEGLGVLSQRAKLLGLPRSGRTSCGGATRLIDTRAGTIALSLARPSDHDLLPAWHALAGGDPATATARELAEAAAELGLPCAAVGEVSDRRPVLTAGLGAAPPRALAGARVISLGALWAGPLAAHLLARMGADVTAVESTTRPDGSRATPAFFAALRRGVKGTVLDFGDPRKLATLLESADVVIEASRPRALRQLGIDAEAIASRGPQVWVSLTAYGRAEPHARRVGFGDDTAAAGNLLARTPDGQAVFLADAVADPLTGLTVAATVADLLERGGRHLADVALARVAAHHAATSP